MPTAWLGSIAALISACASAHLNWQSGFLPAMHWEHVHDEHRIKSTCSFRPLHSSIGTGQNATQQHDLSSPASVGISDN